ncbi:MAG: tRNA pseudouridine(55) synthase TruB [Clostridiales bacterium]|nr:tRNA pseudouridine(55) synthase TruB [Clostridiales bacterium]
MNGIIVIDKPQEMTSHDVVSFLRRKTGVRRIGHTGTLDPMATGVLPVFIGRATRLIEYAGPPGDDEAKVYRAEMTLGVETDTQDIWGTVVARGGVGAVESGELESAGTGGLETGLLRYARNDGRCIDAGEVERVLKTFEGAGKQRPPMYSAVKVGGRKLYEYARRGEGVDEALVKERDVYIKLITVNQLDPAKGVAEFDVHCSKGVYVRTLCADAGRLLGCGAVMSGLRRLKSDGFSIDMAVALDSLRGDDVPMPELLPMDGALGWMERADLDEAGARAFAMGQAVAGSRSCDPSNGSVAGHADGSDNRAYGGENCAGSGIIMRVYGPLCFLGIGSVQNNIIKPMKVVV